MTDHTPPQPVHAFVVDCHRAEQRIVTLESENASLHRYRSALAGLARELLEELRSVCPTKCEIHDEQLAELDTHDRLFPRLPRLERTEG